MLEGCVILACVSENAARIGELIASFPDDVVAARTDETARGRAVTALGAAARPDFEAAMIASDGWATERRGADGFLESFEEWTLGFERFVIEFEELIDRDRVVMVLVRQHGTPRGGAAEIVTDSAAVFYFSGSPIERIEFHLDRARALRAAELEGRAGG